MSIFPDAIVIGADNNEVTMDGLRVLLLSRSRLVDIGTYGALISRSLFFFFYFAVRVVVLWSEHKKKKRRNIFPLHTFIRNNIIYIREKPVAKLTRHDCARDPCRLGYLMK